MVRFKWFRKCLLSDVNSSFCKPTKTLVCGLCGEEATKLCDNNICQNYQKSTLCLHDLISPITLQLSRLLAGTV